MAVSDGANLRSLTSDLIQQRWADLRQREPRQPLQRALYACLRRAIVDGSLPAASRLPASRDLAAELQLSRNTVTAAFDQLMAEGYVRAVTGSGTFVADTVPDHVLWSTGKAPARRRTSDARLVRTGRLSARGERVVANASASPVQWGAFMPGVPDVTQFPHRKFAQISQRLWRKPAPALLTYSPGGGHPQLRAALAAHLRQARSVVCEPEQVLITQGIHQAIDLVARLLADAQDSAWVEEPGYWGIRSLLAMNGVAAEPVPVDAEGMTSRARSKPPKLVFVTPSHQYPLGAVMSLRRRLALLEHAREHGSWIVEDDYDSEFRFSGRPIPALQGLLPDAPVIYVGTFSKTMYPGMRTAYMVLPKPLVAAFRTAHSELYREGHLLTQQVLAEFVAEGHYAAHIRRMRLIYAARRRTLLDLVAQWLGPGWLHPCDSNAGLHLVIALPSDMDDVAVAEAAQRRGVVVRPLSRYYAGPRRERGLVLGFASVPEEDMARPFAVLVQCIRAARRAKAQ